MRGRPREARVLAVFRYWSSPHNPRSGHSRPSWPGIRQTVKLRDRAPQFYCMAMIFLVIRWCYNANWEGTIKWQNKNFFRFRQLDRERQRSLTWKASLGVGFDFALDLSAINGDNEAGRSVRHEPGKVVGHSPSPSPPPRSPTWSWSQSTLGFSWSMSWRSQLSCPVIFIQSDQSLSW